MNQSTVTFPSHDAELAGVLAMPDGAGPYPTALLVAGSGPLDRDGNIDRLKLNTSRDLATMLQEAGWGSFRFDKRGIGDSEGEYLPTGFYDELDDVDAAYRWLQEQPNVGPIVAIGHSAGSLMSVELAGRHESLGGIVLLATTTQTGEDTLRWQTEQMKDHIVPAYVTRILSLFGTSIAKQQEKAIRKLKNTEGDVARIQFQKVNAKWMREFIAYDPMPPAHPGQVPDPGDHRRQGRAGGRSRPSGSPTNRDGRRRGACNTGPRSHLAQRAGRDIEPSLLQEPGAEADRSPGRRDRRSLARSLGCQFRRRS